MGIQHNHVHKCTGIPKIVTWIWPTNAQQRNAESEADYRQTMFDGNIICFLFDALPTLQLVLKAGSSL